MYLSMMPTLMVFLSALRLVVPALLFPLEKIIEQIYFERPKAYEEGLRSLKKKENK